MPELTKRGKVKRKINEILAPSAFRTNYPIPPSLYAMLDKDKIPARYRRNSVVADERRGRTSSLMPELYFANIGRDLGVHPSHVSYIFCGLKRPSLGLLYKICQIFGLNLAVAARVVDPTGTVAVQVHQMGIAVPSNLPPSSTSSTSPLSSPSLPTIRRASKPSPSHSS